MLLIIIMSPWKPTYVISDHYVSMKTNIMLLVIIMSPWKPTYVIHNHYVSTETNICY